MADYRQSCANPACGYTGFTPHTPGCYVLVQSLQREQRERQTAEQENDAWDNFFRGMTDEELFDYADREREAWAKARKHEQRWNRARQYMNNNYKMMRYIDRKRKK